MKVLMLVPQLPLSIKDIKGGAHSAVINLLHGFAFFDIKVTVVSFSKEVKNTVRINFNKNLDIVYEHEGPFSHHFVNYFLFGSSILKKHKKEFEPDIIHFQAGNSFLLSQIKFHAYRIILTIHGMASEEAKRKIKYTDQLKWKLNALVQKLIIPKSIIHLSKFSLKNFDKKLLFNEAIIPNALEDSYFQIPIKESTNNVLLYIGVIDNNKNIINLLKTLKALKDKNIHYSLQVLGDFNNDFYKNYILSYIQYNGLSNDVHFNGWVNTNKVKLFLAQSDILVVSSFHESLPMVIAESMASGKVVVASSVGGIPEMIEDGNDGFLFNLNTPDELYEILEILYNNDSRIQSISQQARLSALKNFNAKVVAGKTIDFYKNCLNQ